MKIKELKQILEKYDNELEVLVDGYEGGLEIITEKQVYELRYVENYNKTCKYNGIHEKYYEGMYIAEDDNHEIKEALLISRYEK